MLAFLLVCDMLIVVLIRSDYMYSHTQVAEIMRSMVPVSRFNKGEAAKIFDEVAQTGIKIAVKNNKPTCILLSPERYEAILEELEELYLMIEIEKRLDKTGHTYTNQEIMNRHGIAEADLEGWEDVVIE